MFRLVAAMQIHSIAAILTFDAGFARYGVTVLDPAVLADDPPPARAEI
jgi:hypothetical protein